MPKKRRYMEKFRVMKSSKKNKHLAITVKWLLGLIGRDTATTAK